MINSYFKAGIGLLSLFLVGCGAGLKTTDRVRSVDALVNPLYQEFYSEAAKRGLAIEELPLAEVQVVDELPRTESGGKTLALCSRSSNTISVRKDLWNSVSDDVKRAIMFHELGHCVLDRDHVTESRDVLVHDGPYSVTRVTVPSSMMYPFYSESTYTFYIAYWDAYLDELFLSTPVVGLPADVDVHKWKKTVLPEIIDDQTDRVSVAMTWEFVIPIKSYHVYRNDGSGNYEFLGIATGNSFIDTKPKIGYNEYKISVEGFYFPIWSFGYAIIYPAQQKRPGLAGNFDQREDYGAETLAAAGSN